MCEKRLNNGYETHQTAFDSMVGHTGKLNCFNEHRIYEMLPLNVTVETPATTNFFVSSLPRFKTGSYAGQALANRIS